MTDIRDAIERLDACRWRIPRDAQAGMRVDGIIYADERLIKGVLQDRAAEQVSNVASLPGIQRASLAMPDCHWGYGFSIGGVAATDPDEGGVVSPGGVGYDINCGVRLLRTDINAADVQDDMARLTKELFHRVPCGVGVGGSTKLSDADETRIFAEGARHAVALGYGNDADLERIESGGRLDGANPDRISDRARERGRKQCGTLGAGNHFVEVQVVDDVYDEEAAQAFGVRKGQLTIMIHTGSRGFGHQVCDEYLKSLRRVPQKYGIELPDRQLVCAPVNSPEGQAYLEAMRCAANYGFANRQMLTHHVRTAVAESLGEKPESLRLDLVYDVAHNCAKLEQHKIGGRLRTLCVHRKGATRAFPAGHPDVPAIYRAVGQPVIIPGDMGTASYLLVGTKRAMEQTFGSTCHGAGRQMSRTAARKSARGRNIARELAGRGVVALSRSREGLAEEQPDAYKDVSAVVEVVHGAGLSRKVCRMRPLGVIKG